MNRSTYAFTLLAVAAALAIAGCGSSSSSSSGGGAYGGGSSSSAESTEAKSENSSSGGAYAAPTETKSSSEASSTPVAAISVGSAAGVGKVLVDSEGMTLYYFQKDQKGSGKSKCSGACASAWPPLLSGSEAEAMSGVQSSMLGTIKRSDGTTQVTYAGWPLYTFVEDKKPGEDNGTDSKAFGASWYPLHPNGEKAGH